MQSPMGAASQGVNIDFSDSPICDESFPAAAAKEQSRSSRNSPRKATQRKTVHGISMGSMEGVTPSPRKSMPLLTPSPPSSSITSIDPPWLSPKGTEIPLGLEELKLRAALEEAEMQKQALQTQVAELKQSAWLQDKVEPESTGNDEPEMTPVLYNLECNEPPTTLPTPTDDSRRQHSLDVEHWMQELQAKNTQCAEAISERDAERARADRERAERKTKEILCAKAITDLDAERRLSRRDSAEKRAMETQLAQAAQERDEERARADQEHAERKARETQCAEAVKERDSERTRADQEHAERKATETQCAEVILERDAERVRADQHHAEVVVLREERKTGFFARFFDLVCGSKTKDWPVVRQ